MPIYEYVCRNCGHDLEVIQKIADAPLVKCPSCGTPKLEKLVSGASFHLKGDGWYVTDFKNSKKAAPVKEAGKEVPSKDAVKSEGAGADTTATPSAETKSVETKSTEPKSNTKKDS